MGAKPRSSHKPTLLPTALAKTSPTVGMMFMYKLLCGKITEWQIFLLVFYYILFLSNTINLYCVVYKYIINTFTVLLISCFCYFIFFITHTENKFIFVNSPHPKLAIENVGKGPILRFVLSGEAPACPTNRDNLRRTAA